MNPHDLAVLRTLTRRSTAVVDYLHRLARLVPETMDPTPLIADLTSLETDIEAFVEDLAAREAASWGRPDHEQRWEAPRRIADAALPLSTVIEPHIKVERFGIDGRPKSQRGAPQPSGHWTQWRGKEKR